MIVTSRDNSPDLIGLMDGSCGMKQESDEHPAVNACDVNMDSFFIASSTAVAQTRYDRMFVIQWQPTVPIHSFYADCYPRIQTINVFVPTELPFLVSPENTAVQGLFPNGVINLPQKMNGRALVLEPRQSLTLPLQNFSFREIRVWSDPELGYYSDQI